MDPLKQWECPRMVLLDAEVRHRRDLLRFVSASIAQTQPLDAAVIFRALWRREAAASTGVGDGLAIPHARIAGIVAPLTVYVRTRTPLDFGAPDAKLVSEFLVILVPADGADVDHLRLLARVAEVFSRPDFRACIAAAANPEAVGLAFAHAPAASLAPCRRPADSADAAGAARI